MVASHNDSFNLSLSGTFQNRVQAALISACVNIDNEGWTVPFHQQRQVFGTQVVRAPGTYVPLFANAVATDATVLADATAGGTIAITSTNSSTAQAAITDAHIDNAVSAMFNTFVSTP